MSKGPIREDKNCLNCGARVEERFCPECGQENTETRKSFHYLFTHFLEDLVHYDSGFWKTLKYLLFNPAKLTREYLSGRRKSFVAPVKLYIFISFITFFISGFFMSGLTSPIKVTRSVNKPKAGITYTSDTTVVKDTATVKKNLLQIEGYGWFGNCKTVRELDSIQNSLPEDKKLPKILYAIARKGTAIAEKNTVREAFDKFTVLFKQNIPKVLFLYMPLFAFSLWLFHGKKRWFYFDHGIFTLHYFAFLLLISSIFILVEEVLDFGHSTITDVLLGLIRTVYILWPVVYFYKAHRKMYNESGFVSFLKGSLLLFINFILMVLVLGSVMIYTLMSIH